MQLLTNFKMQYFPELFRILVIVTTIISQQFYVKYKVVQI